MKVIRSGETRRKPREVTTDCDKCRCEFRFAANEARYVNDPRDGDAYVVSFPECSHENWVSAELFNR